MKFKLNRAFREASGELDGLVYRNVRGKIIVARKPDLSNVVYSESQIAHRARFKQAVAYGRSVMANDDIRALYEEAAQERDIPVFSVTIADYFNAPTIDILDISNYVGQVGNVINVQASDDFSVMSVRITITDQQGTIIEHGDAVETSAGSGQWCYTATAVAPMQTRVTIQAVATDRPGGTGVKTETLNF